MVVLVVVRGGDLKAGARDEDHAMVNGEAAEDESRRDEGLLLAVVRAALPKGGIDFGLRPARNAQVFTAASEISVFKVEKPSWSSSNFINDYIRLYTNYAIDKHI